MRSYPANTTSANISFVFPVKIKTLPLLSGFPIRKSFPRCSANIQTNAVAYFRKNVQQKCRTSHFPSQLVLKTP